VSDERLLGGVGVSPGVAIGPVVVVHWSLPDVPHRVVPASGVAKELKRLREAANAVKDALEQLRERTRQRVGPEEARIFDAQILMVQDDDFIKSVEALIKENQLAAERAFEFKALEMRALWARSSSDRLRDRLADLSSIQVRMLRHLLGESVETLLAKTDGAAIIFTRELTPGLTIQFDRDQVAGFASVEGTRASHAAILARSLGIPCVMGLVNGLERVKAGTEVILDGTQGTLLLAPTKEEMREARGRERRRRALERVLTRELGRPAATVDGTAVSLLGNVDLPEELEAAAQQGAEGVGLVRTEFLVVGRTTLPSEDEQANYFERLARRFHQQPVVIRSYDLGGDKFPAAFRPPPEPNPFLGWRAIRVCLDQPEMFMVQLRALLRARLKGDIRLMLPLVIQVEEVLETKELLAEAARQLSAQRVPHAKDLPLGVMIETPAAALIADQLAKHSDFVSVGSNDLTQYTLAVDRGNARLVERFTPLHPAVVRLLHHVITAADAAGIPASVCGEMASDPISAFLLLGLGYRTLSVAPPALPLLRWLVRQVDLKGARKAAMTALEGTSTAAITAALNKGIAEYVNLRVLEAGRLPRARRQTSFKP
jgi:phosphotransferase system enzyme I (PtsI)